MSESVVTLRRGLRKASTGEPCTVFAGRAAFSARTGRGVASGLAALACLASEANDAGSLTAMSASIFRSSVTPAAFRPLMSWL